jgi:hypothetical protein
MKKVCICIGLMAALFISQAQTKASFGLKAGANFSTWTGHGQNGSELRTGFHAGVLANLPVNKDFFLQPELLFSDEGVAFPEGKYVVHYIKMPILFGYRHPTGFHVETGPQIGVLLDAKTKVKGSPDQDMKEFVNPLEASWATGFGFQWKAGWNVSARYNLGLSKLGEGDTKIRSQVLGVSIAYLLRY